MASLPFELNINLESLFKLNLTYSFDVLKQTIDGLIQNQLELYRNITEENSRSKDKDNLLQRQATPILIKELKESGLLKDFDDTAYLHSHNDNEVVVTMGNVDNNLSGSVIKDNNSNRNNKPSQLPKSVLNEINDRLGALTKRVEHSEKEIGEMSSKMNDMSIIDLFKTSNGGDEETNKDLTSLIIAIEAKTGKKFKSNDERFVKNEEDIFKLKTESTNLKNSLDGLTRSVKNSREVVEGLSSQVESLASSVEAIRNKLQEDNQSQLDQLKALIDTKLMEFNDKLNNRPLDKRITRPIINQEKDDKSSVGTPVILPLQSPPPSDMSKQIREMKKQLEKIASQPGPEALLKEIQAIKDDLSHRCPINQHKELSAIVEELTRKLAVVKDDLLSFIDDSSEKSQRFQSMQKKMDYVMGVSLQFQSALESKQQSPVTPLQCSRDLSKYLEIEVFTDFKAILNEKLTYLSDNIAENRKLIEELFALLKQKAAFRDLKEAEEDIMGKIEDLKLGCQKKFADKVEMGKNLKFLDAQIKSILEVSLRRTDKGDSWLLAKKPLGGHLCASCENYIGDLKESNAYVPWNKYPIKDPNEKLYRLGNGFSKMLQMVGNEPQTDRKDVRNSFATSQECFLSVTGRKRNDKAKEKEKDKEVHTPRRDQSLPRLRPNNDTASLVSENENDVQENLNLTQQPEDDENQQHQPKIMKIYKKAKKLC